jgi:phosphate-selective porin OprO/OprP
MRSASIRAVVSAKRTLHQWAHVILFVAVILAGGAASAQQAPESEQPLPNPPTPEAAPAAPAPSVEDRLKSLEETNRLLREENRKLAEMCAEISRQVRGLQRPPAGAVGGSDPNAPRGVMNATEIGLPAAAATGDVRGSDGPVPSPDPPTRGIVRSSDIGRSPGSSGGTRDQPGAKKLPVQASFGSGFELTTPDDEYQLQIHNMTALEERSYTGQPQTPVRSGFYLARERWYFSGRITKPIEYYTAINRSYGSFDVLDAYLNFRYDDRIQIRAGRYRVPYSFEWYAYPIQYQIQPERSPFAVNFGLNRMLGVMAWGQPFEKEVDYAIGLFNGSRNSFQPFSDSLDFIAFLNGRPFQRVSSLPWLAHLNIGGSVDAGREDNPLYANPLRISQNGTNSSTAIAASPAFLAFNNGTTETGPRTLWSIHMAYYYKHLSLIAEWEAGFDTYARSGQQTAIPLSGYYFTFAYFLTGETVEGRGMVKPLRPFELRKGKFGLGAIEATARFASLDIGSQIFTAGLADPNLWTNRLSVLNLGWNWYLNEYTKVYFLWEHAAFASPVAYRPGVFQSASDMLWMRVMFYF